MRAAPASGDAGAGGGSAAGAAPLAMHVFPERRRQSPQRRRVAAATCAAPAPPCHPPLPPFWLLQAAPGLCTHAPKMGVEGSVGGARGPPMNEQLASSRRAQAQGDCEHGQSQLRKSTGAIRSRGGHGPSAEAMRGQGSAWWAALLQRDEAAAAQAGAAVVPQLPGSPAPRTRCVPGAWPPFIMRPSACTGRGSRLARQGA